MRDQFHRNPPRKYYYCFFDFLNKCRIKDAINKIIKTKKVILAISAAAIATPVKPNIPAMMDIIKNINIHENNSRLVPNKNKIREKTNKIRKIKNIILLIATKAAAILVKPSSAAIIAIIRNVKTRANMVNSF